MTIDKPLTSPPLLASAAGSASSPPSDLRADSPLTVSVEGMSDEPEVCSTCEGIGWVTVGNGPGARDLPCGDCAECDEDEHGRIIAMCPREVVGLGGGLL